MTTSDALLILIYCYLQKETPFSIVLVAGMNYYCEAFIHPQEQVQTNAVICTNCSSWMDASGQASADSVVHRVEEEDVEEDLSKS